MIIFFAFWENMELKLFISFILKEKPNRQVPSFYYGSFYKLQPDYSDVFDTIAVVYLKQKKIAYR